MQRDGSTDRRRRDGRHREGGLLTHEPAPTAAAPRDSVVLAWEASGEEDDRTRLTALDVLAALARTIDAAILLPIDADSERLFPRIVAVLTRHRVAALPVVSIDGRSDKGCPYAAREAVAMLRALVAAGAVAEWAGERFLGIAADESIVFDDAHESLCEALAAPGQIIRVGWVRRRSAQTPLPQGFSFTFDWLPYGGQLAAGATPFEYDYALLATEIARLRGGDSPVSPSVLWSLAPSVVLPHAATRVTGVTPLKVAYAIDAARRFVRNRAGHGVPFWVLRAAFNPGAPAEVAALSAMPAVLMNRRGAGQPAARVELPVRSRARIAAVVHLYFPELWNELAAAIAMLPEPCDVFVSCPFRARDAIERLVRSRFPDAVVFGTRNLGRDVLPFLHWLAAAGADRYDYVLKLHSKKSLHVVDAMASPLGGGEGWRRQALAGLVGELSHVAALLRALDASPDVGIVAPTSLLYDQVTWRCATRDLLAALCERLALDGSAADSFAAGAMFWARPAALAPLAHAPAHLLDFECEAGQVDSTLHHAYERLFPLVAAAQGYRTVDAAQLEEFARQRAA